jgi:hypothetical protein
MCVRRFCKECKSGRILHGFEDKCSGGVGVFIHAVKLKIKEFVGEKEQRLRPLDFEILPRRKRMRKISGGEISTVGSADRSWTVGFSMPRKE